MFFQDSRDYQIVFLCSFLLLGIATRDWTIQPQLVAVVLGGMFACPDCHDGINPIALEFPGS